MPLLISLSGETDQEDLEGHCLSAVKAVCLLGGGFLIAGGYPRIDGL